MIFLRVARRWRSSPICSRTFCVRRRCAESLRSKEVTCVAISAASRDGHLSHFAAVTCNGFWPDAGAESARSGQKATPPRCQGGRKLSFQVLLERDDSRHQPVVPHLVDLALEVFDVFLDEVREPSLLEQVVANRQPLEPAIGNVFASCRTASACRSRFRTTARCRC